MNTNENGELDQHMVESNLEYFYQEHKSLEIELQSKRLEIITFLKKHYNLETENIGSNINIFFNFTEPRLITLKKQELFLLTSQISGLKYMNDILMKQTSLLKMKKENPEAYEEFMKTNKPVQLKNEENSTEEINVLK
jgi:hypothetical protein